MTTTKNSEKKQEPLLGPKTVGPVRQILTFMALNSARYVCETHIETLVNSSPHTNKIKSHQTIRDRYKNAKMVDVTTVDNLRWLRLTNKGLKWLDIALTSPETLFAGKTPLIEWLRLSGWQAEQLLPVPKKSKGSFGEHEILVSKFVCEWFSRLNATAELIDLGKNRSDGTITNLWQFSEWQLSIVCPDRKMLQPDLTLIANLSTTAKNFSRTAFVEVETTTKDSVEKAKRYAILYHQEQFKQWYLANSIDFNLQKHPKPPLVLGFIFSNATAEKKFRAKLSQLTYSDIGLSHVSVGSPSNRLGLAMFRTTNAGESFVDGWQALKNNYRHNLFGG